MLTLTLEQKRAVCARQFYYDNSDEYDSEGGFSVALKDMTDPESAPPENFMDSVISFLPIAEYTGNGYRFMYKEGNIIAVNNATGHMMPMTNLPENEGEKVEADFKRVTTENPSIESTMVLLQKLDWVLL